MRPLCSFCGKYPTSDQTVFCITCLHADRPNAMVREQYILQLERFRKRIAEGAPLETADSEEIGDKFTLCSWGLCDDSAEMWPEKELHHWPHSFLTEGRTAPLRVGHGQKCPMDKRETGDRSFSCFFHCRVFQGPKPDQQEALRLYDLCLDRMKSGQLT